MFLLFRRWHHHIVLDGDNLHSNMFLLFPLTDEALISMFKIYIPICFYYFGKAKITKDPNCKFTFQYVSIISCEQCCFFVLKNLFTFQYVSIISRYNRKRYKIHIKFTFQYVSIISFLYRCLTSV